MRLSTITFAVAMLFVALFAFGCDINQNSSDKIQQAQQETMLKEATAQTGMPAIVNFWERKQLKRIFELRDQSGYVTFTYLENMIPTVIPGRTSLGGKLTFFGQTIGYGIPYSTQYTSPQKATRFTDIGGEVCILPQADPNGLFSPSEAAGTWVLMQNGKDLLPVFCEPGIVVMPFKLPTD